MESKNLAEQTVRNKNILEVLKTQDKYGINFSTRNNVQTRVASIQTSPLCKTIPEGGKDAQLTDTCNNNTHITQQSSTIQLKEIQATKHQQYMQYKSQLSSKESVNTIDQEHQPSHETRQLYNKKNIHSQISQHESSRKHNSSNSICDNTQFS